MNHPKIEKPPGFRLKSITGSFSIFIFGLAKNKNLWYYQLNSKGWFATVHILPIPGYVDLKVFRNGVRLICHPTIQGCGLTLF